MDPDDAAIAQILAQGPNGPPATSLAPDDAALEQVLRQGGNVSGPAMAAPQMSSKAQPVSQPPQVGPLEDAARSIPGGLVKGLAGIGSLPGLVGDAGNYLLNKVGLPQIHLPDGGLATNSDILGQFQSARAANGLPNGGAFYQPQGAAGNVAQTAASYLPAVALTGGLSAVDGIMPMAGNVVKQALIPAATSEAAGYAAKGTPYESAARLGGALLGGVGPGLVSSGFNALGRALVNSGSDNSVLQDLADKASDLGIDIRPAQTSNVPFIKTADDQLSRIPFTGYAEEGTKIAPEAQGAQFVRAVSRTFGEDAPALTPDIMATAKSNIGGMFTKGLNGVTVSSTPEIDSALSDLGSKINEVSPALADGDVSRLTKTLAKIQTSIANGLTGTQYQAMRQTGGLLSSLSEDANPTVANLGSNMRETLDQAFQDQAPQDQADMISQARQYYRNFKAVEPLADKAPLGNISPSLLLGQVNKAYPDLSSAGDIGDLGRIGQAFLKSPANSNTAERGLILSLATNPLEALGKALALPVSATIGRGLSSAINPDSTAVLLAKTLARGMPSAITQAGDTKSKMLGTMLGAQ